MSPPFQFEEKRSLLPSQRVIPIASSLSARPSVTVTCSRSPVASLTCFVVTSKSIAVPRTSPSPMHDCGRVDGQVDPFGFRSTTPIESRSKLRIR